MRTKFGEDLSSGSLLELPRALLFAMLAFFALLLLLQTDAWQLRWSDEFDGDALNATLWTAAANDSEAPPRWNQVRDGATAAHPALRRC
jgi:hypothetical protein